MKRPCEDSSSVESDMEETIDVGHEMNYTRQMKTSFIRHGSPTSTTQVMARKKRRGVIEKRRRDRINHSLSELRRLVPTAFEKQGSAKLEKAEILQMTVDHLKMLQETGKKGYFDAHAIALDFLSLGIKECITEVSCYLSTVEGLDSNDPLHSRLLSHLTCFSSQRDAAALTAISQLHQQPLPLPPLFHPHHWAAAVGSLHPLPYELSGFLVSPDARGGRLMELPQQHGATSSFTLHSGDSASSSPSSSSSSIALSCTPSPLSTISFPSSYPFTIHRGFPVFPPSSFSTTLVPSSLSISSSSSSQTSISSTTTNRSWTTEVGAF